MGRAQRDSSLSFFFLRITQSIKIPVNGMMMTTPKEETAWKCEPATTGAKPRLAPVPATEVPKINDTDLAEDARLSKCVKVYRNGVKIFNIGKEWVGGHDSLVRLRLIQKRGRNT